MCDSIMPQVGIKGKIPGFSYGKIQPQLLRIEGIKYKKLFTQNRANLCLHSSDSELNLKDHSR